MLTHIIHIDAHNDDKYINIYKANNSKNLTHNSYSFAERHRMVSKRYH